MNANTYYKRRREAAEDAREQRAHERVGVLMDFTEADAVPVAVCSRCFRVRPSADLILDNHGGQVCRCPGECHR